MAVSNFEPLEQRYRWRLVGLLSVSIFINYMDRGNLSVAAPVLGRELSLSPAHLGLLFSAFFWTYALFQIPAGWLVDRFGAKRLYAAAYLLWSAATLLTGFAHGLTALLMVRLLLGLGESVAYPACSQILVRKFSEHERGRANSLIDVGAKAGPALGTLLGGLIVACCGWRILFIGAGAIGLLWLAPWYRWAGAREGTTQEQGEPGPSLIQIAVRRDMLGTSLGLFCFGYVWYFLLTWLPSYLVMERHFSLRAMALFGALPFCGSALSALFSGWASDRLIARGASVTRVRKSFVVAGMLLCTLILPGAMVRDPVLAMTLLTMACLAIGLFSSNVWANSNPCRPHRSRKMVRNAERRRQHGRSGLAPGDRIGSFPHSFLFPRLCGRNPGALDRGRSLSVSGGGNSTTLLEGGRRKCGDQRVSTQPGCNSIRLLERTAFQSISLPQSARPPALERRVPRWTR